MAPRPFPRPLKTLSWSKVFSYDNCPACFYKANIEGRPTPVRAILALGSGVHAAVETARRALIAGREVSPEECETRAFEVLAKELSRAGDRGIDLQKFESPQAVEDRMQSVIEVALRDIVPNDQLNGQVLLSTEGTLDFEHVFDFAFGGKFDALVGLKEEGQVEPVLYMVKDLKTAGADTEGVSSDQLQQLTTYALPFAAPGMALPYLAIERITTTLHPTARRFIAKPTVDQMAAVKEKIEAVAEDIMAGRFPERPGRMCDFFEEHRLPTQLAFPPVRLSPEPAVAPKRTKATAPKEVEGESEAARPLVADAPGDAVAPEARRSRKARTLTPFGA